MSGIDWLIVVVLNGSVIAYGFYLARGTSSSSEWFLGRRALPWWAVGLSMFATDVDNADLVSLTGLTYTQGLHFLTAGTLGRTIGGILCAFWIIPVIYRAGMYTNAEYLEARFGPTTRVVSALIQIQYRSCMLGLMIQSVYLLLTGLVGLEPFLAWTLIVALVLLAAVYTAWGGLKTVVATDTLQGIVMMVGATVIFMAVWNVTGGWSGMMAKLNTADERARQSSTLQAESLQARQSATDLPYVGRFRGSDGHTSPFFVALGWVIMVSAYWIVNHTQTMRLMGSRSLWDMKMAAIFGTAVSMPIVVSCATLGLFGRALFPAFENPDQLYPHMAQHFLGVGLKGLVVAAIVAAAVSTFDSMGSALSAVFTRDIYARLLVRNRDDAHYVRAGQWATFGILGLGFAYLPFIATKHTMVSAYVTLTAVFVTPLLTVYLAGVFTRAHRRSGLVGLVCGATYGLVAFLDREVYDLPWLPSWLTGSWVAFSWALLITATAITVTTMLMGRQAENKTLTIDQRGWLKNSREELPVVREHPFAQKVPFLLRPEWFAVALLAVTSYLVFGVFW